MENADYSQPFVQPPCTAGDLYSHLAEREYLRLDRDTIHLKERIGQGHFAHVFKGEWNLVSIQLLDSIGYCVVFVNWDHCASFFHISF